MGRGRDCSSGGVVAVATATNMMRQPQLVPLTWGPEQTPTVDSLWWKPANPRWRQRATSDVSPSLEGEDAVG